MTETMKHTHVVREREQAWWEIYSQLEADVATALLEEMIGCGQDRMTAKGVVFTLTSELAMCEAIHELGMLRRAVCTIDVCLEEAWHDKAIALAKRVRVICEQAKINPQLFLR